MAEWKKEIARLAKDFDITRFEILSMFKEVEREYINKDIPAFYKGNKDEFLYDKVRGMIMDKVFA